MYLAQWWAAEARYEQCAPKRAHCNSGDELEVLFHNVIGFVSFGARAKA